MHFEELYQQYWQRVFRLCMGYLNDEEAAKDLAQESFMIIWQQLPKFREESAIGTWIFRIVSNTCLRQINRERRIPLTAMPEQINEEAQESIEPKIKLLYQFISELPELERIIISLELEELKQAEIANITGLSEGNVRVKIHRIKEKLAQNFKSYGR